MRLLELQGTGLLPEVTRAKAVAKKVNFRGLLGGIFYKHEPGVSVTQQTASKHSVAYLEI